MRSLFALAPLLIAAAPAPVLTIGGEVFAQGDILDARGLPDAGGTAILVTVTPRAAARLAAVTRAHIGKAIVVAFNGHVLAAPMIAEPAAEGALQWTGTLTLAEAVALAKRVSGKDPLPESLEE